MRNTAYISQCSRPARRTGPARDGLFNLRPLVAALAALGLAQPLNAQQLPQGPMVINGSASVRTDGSQMTITNSPNAILNWESFSIGAQNAVRFQQENSASQVLNRATGNDPSQILGSLSSNGRVWLINPHGVLFGQNARIDVAGLVASTLDIANADFLANRYNFVAGGGPNRGEVMNKGEIRTSFGGRVWLLGELVQNEGLIETPGGQIVLAAGKSIELIDSGMPHVIVQVTAPENQAMNLGTLLATGGSVDLHAGIVNQEGIIRAESVATDATGRIVLKATNDVMLADGSKTQAGSGRVTVAAGNTLNNRGEVSGEDITLSGNQVLQQGVVKAPGGKVTLTAQASTYLDGSVDASDPEGRGGSIKLTTGKLEGMAGGALKADGKHGGNIRIEGHGMVAFSSSLSAAGQDQGGNIEVTGDKVYLLNADVDASGGTQGGTVHLGGGWQGNGDLSHAREVLVGLGSEVKANGAKGGEIAVWSTQSSEHYGSLQATRGGRIELSSKGEIRQTGDLQAGPGGSVLFDPKNLIITDAPPDNLALARTVVSGNVDGQPQLADGDSFGSSVALDGDLLAVGAPDDDTSAPIVIESHHPSHGQNTGAVHLFTGVGTNFAGLTWRKKLASGRGATDMPLLSNFDNFGAAVALDGDRLVVGAPGDSVRAGAVHVFTGVGSDFSSVRWQKKLASSIGATDMPTLANSQRFGTAVALDGDRLAVASPGDLEGVEARLYLFNGVGVDFSGLAWRRTLQSGDGTVPSTDASGLGNSVALKGDLLAAGAPFDNAVHLFNGANSANFSAVTWQKELTSGAGATNMPTLGEFDGFGRSLSLSDGRLFVGAPFSGGESSQGSVHGFNGVGTDFSGLLWTKTIKSGTGAIDMPALSHGDQFGSAVAFDGDRLVVGSPGYDGSDAADRGAAYLFTGLTSSGTTIGVNDATFSFNQSDTSYIRPATIKAMLGEGTAVTLQANNDITVSSPVIVGNDVGGDFTLRAGRHITFDASVAPSLGGNLTAVAGDESADPAFRDPGSPTLTINPGVTLGNGSGTTTLAAIGGNFVNNNGDAAIQTGGECCGGRWLIYAADPATSTEGFTRYNKHYNQNFTIGITPDYAAEGGNWFLYRLAPTLSVIPASQTITYGDATPDFVPLLSSFIDGDTADTAALSGTATWSIGGSISSSGKITRGTHDVSYLTGLSSDLGYRFADNALSSNELAVNAKTLTASDITALDKVYDGTVAATLSGGSLSGGVIAGDIVSLSAATGSFDTKNVGFEKTVTIARGSLSGADADNYTLSSASGTTTADITRRLVSISAITAQDKVYDGTVAATLSGGTPSGIILGDEVNLSSPIGTFDNKNVGNDKTVTIAIGPLTGVDEGNYELGSTDGTTTADVTPRSLTLNYSGLDKTYDGTTDATVIGNSVDILPGDVVNFTQSAAFTDKNAGIGKTINVNSIDTFGTDAGNYQLTDTTAVTTANISAKSLSVFGFIAQDKIYDGTTTAVVSEGTVVGLVPGDVVNFSGTSSAFTTKDVGVDKVVAISGGSLSGADAGNYTVDFLDSANADITPATLTFLAAPTLGVATVPFPSLTGTVTGFQATDTLSNATTGTLNWTTPATPTSPAGSYPINGGGLSAINYVFAEAPSNSTALTLVSPSRPDLPQEKGANDSLQGLDAAKRGTDPIGPRNEIRVPPLDPIFVPDPYRLSDLTFPPDFGELDLSSMSRDEIRQLLDSRKEFKKKLFAEAIYKLEEDPSLAEVPACPSVADIGSGLCLMTDAQRRELAAKATQSVQSKRKVKLATLPQIERKVAVLFGINEYTNPRMKLSSPIRDVETVGKLLEDKLGYEVKVVTNPTKADIFRTLNQLSIETQSNDSVIVYYAGHGQMIDKTGVGYWLPGDASESDPSNWISNKDISRLLSDISAKQLAMISDSCYSGAFTKEEKVKLSANVKVGEVLSKRSVVVLSSGGDEPVADGGRRGHSVFAFNLMQSVGQVDKWQPGTNVFEEVQRAVSKRKFPQTPQYGAAVSAGHQAGGDFLFEFRQLEDAQ